MKIALVQINPTVADIEHNVARIIRGLRDAESAGADLAVFAEQVVLGYPAKDLLLRAELIDRNVSAVARIANECRRIAAIVGFAEPNQNASGRPVFNSAAFLENGRIAAIRRKRLLPTYDVFDEARYFEPAGEQPPVEIAGRKIGLTVCEDMWAQEELGSHPLYACDPIADLVRQGAELIVNISASPYYLDKHAKRIELMSGHARRGAPLLFVNQVGGNDELVFDGCSCVVAVDGRVAVQARAFDEDLVIAEFPAATRGAAAHPIIGGHKACIPTGPAGMHAALTLGLRDYARKCGFGSAVLGLSGGIDSAVVAALAVAALGRENVHGVAMPSRYSSEHSLADARELAKNLGIQLSEIAIEPLHASFERVLLPHFGGRPPDVTEENVQARIRGVLLMALSNKFGSLLLTTGNKSELAVGYCTLYGDMCGGLAVISDVPKTAVYAMAQYINETAGRPVIPNRTLTKPPSAELRPNQLDQDSLPPYEVLDAILEQYEVAGRSAAEIVMAGFDARVVGDVIRRVHQSEYKRQQAAPGLKVTRRAFGFGRRMPIAARLG
ncbi:MAG: NAD+ synthase [Phycisphaerales bacterium]|nr:NAD+ synthase [Phycisphaerales bacterium]